MHQVSEDLLERWLKGWSISREKPLPETWKSGFKVEVGDELQRARYVFPRVNEDFIQLSETIHESWVYLKVCEPFEKFRSVIPERWQIQPQGYMMYCQEKMNIRENPLPDDYSMEVFQPQPDSFIVKIYTANKQVAAVGRLILVDGLAVYDRIETDKDYQRKGFATQIIRELEFIALSKGISENFLVASAQGKLLYESLGWKIYSLYSTIVIPEDH